MHQSLESILFWNNTVHVSDGLSVHHQEFKTVHTATGICQTDTADCLLPSRQQYLFDIFFFYSIVPSSHNKQIKVADCYNWLTSNMFRPYSTIIRLTTDGVN